MRDAMKGLADQLDTTSLMARQNRLALDMIPTSPLPKPQLLEPWMVWPHELAENSGINNAFWLSLSVGSALLTALQMFPCVVGVLCLVLDIVVLVPCRKCQAVCWNQHRDFWTATCGTSMQVMLGEAMWWQACEGLLPFKTSQATTEDCRPKDFWSLPWLTDVWVWIGQGYVQRRELLEKKK